MNPFRQPNEQEEDFEAQLKEDQAEFLKEQECQTCLDIREKYKGFGPSHDGSKHCESGSIASGGKNAHCACDVCF